jgi:hypothetical protein
MRHVQRCLPPDAGTALNLRISGFAGAAISPDEVLAALEAVPTRHLAGLREIGFFPEEARFSPPSLQAAYHQRERVIRFLRLPPWPLFRYVLHHEIGHHVYALVISSKVKTQWTQRAFRRSAPASDYGASSPEEDFAESYARHIEPGQKPQAFAAKDGFMRDLVFCGDPWTLKERVAL